MVRWWAAIVLTGCRFGFAELGVTVEDARVADSAPSGDDSASGAAADAPNADAFSDPSFEVTDFATCPEIAFAGTAQCTGVVLALTADTASQTAAAWSTQSFAITPTTTFTVRATLRFGTTGSPVAGDGATITVHADPRGVSAVNGAPGGNLGYAGITPSRAVELDVFQNSLFSDPAGHHVGLDRDGSMTSTTTAAAPFSLTAAAQFTVWLDYDGPSQTVSAFIASTTTKPQTPIVTVTDDLSRLGSAVWVGLTASGGLSYQRHHVLAWRFDYLP